MVRSVWWIWCRFGFWKNQNKECASASIVWASKHRVPSFWNDERWWRICDYPNVLVTAPVLLLPVVSSVVLPAFFRFWKNSTSNFHCSRATIGMNEWIIHLIWNWPQQPNSFTIHFTFCFHRIHHIQYNYVIHCRHYCISFPPANQSILNTDCVLYSIEEEWNQRSAPPES